MKMKFLLKLFLGLTVVGVLTLFVIYTSSFINKSTTSSVQVINNVRFYSDHLYQYLNHNNIKNILTKNLSQEIVNKETFRRHDHDTANLTIIKEEEVQTSSAIFKEVKIIKTKEPEPPTALEQNTLPLCSERGNNLVGPMFIDQTIPKDMGEIEKTFSVANGGTIEKGGWWSPATCQPRKKVAIIVPFRQRHEQLKIFLRHMHAMLQRQEIFYRIVVVDQLEDDPFNRAGLFNIGFVEALKLGDFDCFVFSDVDLLPEDDRNYYGCPTSPRHMSVAVDKFGYRLPYTTIFGGVGAFSRKDFEKINGFSNLFWGWGGEDDDLYRRITTAGFQLTRPSLRNGRYTMIQIHHVQSSKANPNRGNLLRNSNQRMTADGLNTLKYTLVKVDEQPLVTIIGVKLKKSMYS